MRKGGIAGAEVVESELDAEGLQRVEVGRGLSPCRARMALSVISSTRRPASRRVALRADATSSTRPGSCRWVGEMFTERQEAVRERDLGTELLHRLACWLQHPAVDLNHEAGLLGEGEERGRRQEATLGVVPAHEGLDADDAVGHERKDRLKVNRELPRVDGVLELAPRGRAACRASACMVSSNDDDAPLALALGDVLGGVGVAQQRLGAGGNETLHRDSDACAQPDASAADGERLGEEREDALGRRDGVGRRRDVLDEHRELVAAEAGHRVAGAHAAAQPVSERDRAPRRPRRGPGCR